MGENYEKSKDQAIKDLERELDWFRQKLNEATEEIKRLKEQIDKARERGGGVWP